MEALLYALSKFDGNARWIREHYGELKRAFIDEWVAVMDCRVVDHDRGLVKLVDRLRRRYPGVVCFACCWSWWCCLSSGLG